MRSVALAEAKDKLSELVAAAEAGEEIVITRHGKPAARLTGSASPRSRVAAMEQLLAVGQTVRQRHGPTTIDEIIAWRNEGRR